MRGCCSNGFGEVPIVGAARVQVIYQAVDNRPIAQPAAFEDVKRRGIIEIGERLPSPWDVVEKFQYRCAFGTNLADVGSEDFPSIVVNLLNFRIVDLQKWNIA